MLEPFSVGTRVRVVALTDDTARPEYLNAVGTVVLVHDEVSSPSTSGEVARDPFYIVAFDTHITTTSEVVEQDGFWREELALVEGVEVAGR